MRRRTLPTHTQICLASRLSQRSLCTDEEETNAEGIGRTLLKNAQIHVCRWMADVDSGVSDLINSTKRHRTVKDFHFPLLSLGPICARLLMSAYHILTIRYRQSSLMFLKSSTHFAS